MSSSPAAPLPTRLTVSIGVDNQPTCAYANGSIYASASGGVGPYTYLWSPGGETTSLIANLAPGTYSVTVTDANSDQATDQVTITSQPYVVTTGYPNEPGLCQGLVHGHHQPIDDTDHDPRPTSLLHGRCTDDGTDAQPGDQLDVIVHDAVLSHQRLWAGVHVQLRGWEWLHRYHQRLEWLAVGVARSDHTGCARRLLRQQQRNGDLPDRFGRALADDPGVRDRSQPSATNYVGFYVGTFTATGLAAGDRWIGHYTDQNIWSPGFGCADSVLFTVPDPGNGCANMSGSVFVDDNENCTPGNEPFVPGALLEILPGPYYTLTNANGVYSIDLPLGNYTVEHQARSSMSIAQVYRSPSTSRGTSRGSITRTQASYPWMP
ncbi:MAG: hypothetical protein IPL52_02840 [Flavobacteriales bacterium]|nr:hypothetical protein [Flavobacteriales bacterium]